MSSKRELELELELWASRIETVKMAARAIQAEGQALNAQMKECQENVARLQAALREVNTDAGAQPVGDQDTPPKT